MRSTRNEVLRAMVSVFFVGLAMGWNTTAVSSTDGLALNPLLPRTFSGTAPAWRRSRNFYALSETGVRETECPPGINVDEANRQTCAQNPTEIPTARFWSLLWQAGRTGADAHDLQAGVGPVDPLQVKVYDANYAELLAAEDTLRKTGLPQVQVGGTSYDAAGLSDAIWRAGRRASLARDWQELEAALTRRLQGQPDEGGLIALRLRPVMGLLTRVFHGYRLTARRNGQVLGRVATLQKRASFVFSEQNGNLWATLADNVGALGSSPYEWLPVRAALAGEAKGQRVPGQEGEVGCTEVYGRGWHLATYAELKAARPMLEGSALGTILADQWIWSGTSSGTTKKNGAVVEQFYAIRLHRRWNEWRYTSLSAEPTVLAVPLCVCGPAAEAPALRVPRAVCQKHVESLPVGQ